MRRREDWLRVYLSGHLEDGVGERGGVGDDGRRLRGQLHQHRRHFWRPQHLDEGGQEVGKCVEGTGAELDDGAVAVGPVPGGGGEVGGRLPLHLQVKGRDGLERDGRRRRGPL